MNDELENRDISPDMGENKSCMANTENQKEKEMRFFTMFQFKRWLKKWAFGVCIKLPSLILAFGLFFAIALMVDLWQTPSAYTYEDSDFNYKNDPSSYLKPYNESFKYNFLIDGHSHTKNTDGKLSPQQVVEWARAEGFNGIIHTDHNLLKSSMEAREYARQKYPNEFIVILGEEYTTCRIHMNLIGIHTQIDVGSPNPSDEEIQDIIRQTHEQGGMVVVNHIPWSNNTQNERQIARLPNHPSREQLLEWGVDYFEVINGASNGIFDLETLKFVDENRDKLGYITGSDMHSPIGTFAWTTLNVAEVSEEAVWDALKSKNTNFMFDATGTFHRVWPDWDHTYEKLSPIAQFGEYVQEIFYYENKGQYDFQGGYCQGDDILYVRSTNTGFFFLYFFIIYFMAEFIFEMVYLGHRYYRFRQIKRRVYSSHSHPSPKGSTHTSISEPSASINIPYSAKESKQH
eukprot:Nk52_evm20s554 gene=Nk52_evmTU20s554